MSSEICPLNTPLEHEHLVEGLSNFNLSGRAHLQTLQAAQVAVKALFYILTHSKDGSLNSECKQMIISLCEKFSVQSPKTESDSPSD